MRADVGSAADVARLVAEIREGDHPLRGVFHLAMVIDDAPLASLTRDRMRSCDGTESPMARGCCTRIPATWNWTAS